MNKINAILSLMILALCMSGCGRKNDVVPSNIVISRDEVESSEPSSVYIYTPEMEESDVAEYSSEFGYQETQESSSGSESGEPEELPVYVNSTETVENILGAIRVDCVDLDILSDLYSTYNYSNVTEVAISFSGVSDDNSEFVYKYELRCTGGCSAESGLLKVSLDEEGHVYEIEKYVTYTF